MNELTTIQTSTTATIDSTLDTQLVTVSDSLRQGLGANAEGNIALVNDLLATASPQVQRDLLASGVLNKPHVIAWIAAVLDDDDAGIEDTAGIEREVRKIEAMMANRTSAYWRGPDSERLQARYRTLIGSR